MSKNTRTLKVYYGYHGRPYAQHPVIRIKGKYLTALDFKIGDTVEVSLEKGRIVITNKKVKETINNV